MRLQLSEEWARKAITLAEAQLEIPKSPARRVEDKLQLCAAACIAMAGYESAKPSEALVFQKHLEAACDDKEIVLAAFQDLGLQAEMCLGVMKLNDTAAPAHRMAVLRSVLGVA